MAKATRDSKLETRTARAKLPATHEPYWRLIGQGLYLGYRKGPQGAKWVVRHYTGGQYIKRVLSEADDYRDANGLDVLNYFQAQDNARQFADECVHREKATGTTGKPLTVADAAVEYLTWYKTHRRAYNETKGTIDTHILPQFKDHLLSALTMREIKKWHEGLALVPARRRGTVIPFDSNNREHVRKRKASANRILTVLKALLNHVYNEGLISNDTAWKPVKPFHNVDAPKIQYLTEAEISRLVNVCKPHLKDIVRGCLYTGGRYGELTAVKCRDYNPDSGTIYFSETKNKKTRHVPLTDEGQKFFESLIAGRPGDDFTFKRSNGLPWGKSHQSRPLRDACKKVRIVPEISFHILRHCYASHLAMRGVSLQVLAEVLGHSDTRTTGRHYAHLSPSYVADQIRANLPSFKSTETDNVRILKRT